MELRDYMISAFAVTCMLTLIALLRAPSATERAERVAFSLIGIAALAAPTAAAVTHLGTLITLPEGALPEVDAPFVEEAAAAAFAEGIRAAVCEEFSVDTAAVTVEVEGFSLADARAERITVILRGGAVTVDHHALERFIEKEGWGECDVRREAG